MINALKAIRKKMISAQQILSGYVYLATHSKKKFSIGSGNALIGNDWYYTNIDTLDITKESDWKLNLLGYRLDNIYAEHVWEHLTDDHTALANKNCYQFLKKGGVLRIAVPDGFHTDRDYIEYVRPGGYGDGADDHKILYTYKTMTERLEKAGFSVVLLEYWDENGVFHYVDWTNESGQVSRSRRYDERNANGELKYTSLIVDAVKK